MCYPLSKQRIYFANKFIAWKEDNVKGNWGFRNLTIFRYAEVLLMYAEACAQTDDSDGLGLKCLQDIQNRAVAVSEIRKVPYFKEKRRTS